MGATVTAPTHTAHPIMNPARLPNAKCGYRVDPPATGYIPPSSACTRARTIITRAPIIQEINAAGPAICDAYRAPKSHPDPMIDPSDTKRSPILLTSLFSLPPPASLRASVCVAITNPPLLAEQIHQHTHDSRSATPIRSQYSTVPKPSVTAMSRDYSCR